MRVDVIRTGGIGIDPDSGSAVTAEGGFWHIEFSPSTPGTLETDVVVSPPGLAPYRLHRIQLSTREHRGDGNLNERWTPALYFEAFGEFYLAGTSDQRVKGASVVFRRTGGVDWYGAGVQNGLWRDTTDFGGRVSLFPSQGTNTVFVREDGPLIGDLTVRLKDGQGLLVLPGISLGPTHVYRGPHAYAPILRAAVPPSPTASSDAAGDAVVP